MSRFRVFARYCMARYQLAPVLDHVEKTVLSEDWSEARDALRDFARALGIAYSGTADLSVRISTEWLPALDKEDHDRFMGFVDTLTAIVEDVTPRALRAPWVKPFEPVRIESLFRTLRSELSWLQDVMRDDSDAYQHGPFQIIPTKGVGDPKEAIETLDKVRDIIHPKFPEVLYGKVYIRKDLRAGTYGPRPNSGQIAGTYMAARDTITLSMYATPTRNSVMTLVHEFGHRYHTRFLKGDKRERFIHLFEVGDEQTIAYSLSERRGFADEYIARERLFREADKDDNSPVWDSPHSLSDKAEAFFKAMSRDRDYWKAHVSPLVRKLREEGDDSVEPKLRDALARSEFGGTWRMVVNPDDVSPVYASNYGRTSWEENFAEAFLAFCMHMELPKPLHDFMASL